MKRLLLIALCGALLSCDGQVEDDHTLHLDGVWRMTQFVNRMGEVLDVSANGLNQARVYEGDSVVHTFQMQASPAGLVVLPGERFSVTFIDKGGGDFLYLEDGEPKPLKMVSDSVITLQRYGIVYTWVKVTEMMPEQVAEICSIIRADSQNDSHEHANHYVLSTKERSLKRDRSLLIIILVAVVAMMLWAVKLIMVKQQRIHQAEEQIRQLTAQREQRAQPLTDAIHDVETAFFASDYYHSLRKTIAGGKMLNDADWQEVERRLQQVYPGFTANLRSLYRMSDIEYKVSLLIKLRFAPKEMAQLLARDVSTISSIRSRLYEKVFGRKGSAKEWDEVVLCIGA